MRFNYVHIIPIIPFFLAISLHAQKTFPEKPQHSSLFRTVEDTIDINNIELHIDNAGSIGLFEGGIYPAGSGLKFLFSAGFGVTGLVNGELRTAWSTRISLIDEFKPGPIDAHPLDSLDGIYEVTSADTFGSANYISWEKAVQAGADFQDLNGDGIYNPNFDRPDILGDQTLWTVYNDLTDLAQRTPRLMTSPLNIEVQQTVWGYEATDTKGDMLFFRYRLINRGISDIEQAIITFTADPDIGDFEDDLIGSDVLRQMGYCYNFEEDGVYGTTPPAFGIVLLQGPIIEKPGGIAYRYRGEYFSTETILNSQNQPIQSFTTYIGGDPILSEPATAQIARNYGVGCLDAWGSAIDPTYWGIGSTSLTDCRFLYSGDPVSVSGWLSLQPQDSRMLLSPNEFRIAKGDTQEVIMAYVVAQGIDELDAITEIRQRADLAASIIGFNNTPVGIEPASESSINSFQLRQNYPNPFNPSTAIEFTIRRNAFVELTIYNSLGQQLQILQKGSLPSGSYRIPFSAEGLEAGIYFYRLKVDGQSRVRKMIYMP